MPAPVEQARDGHAGGSELCHSVQLQCVCAGSVQREKGWLSALSVPQLQRAGRKISFSAGAGAAQIASCPGSIRIGRGELWRPSHVDHCPSSPRGAASEQQAVARPEAISSRERLQRRGYDVLPLEAQAVGLRRRRHGAHPSWRVGGGRGSATEMMVQRAKRPRKLREGSGRLKVAVVTIG